MIFKSIHVKVKSNSGQSLLEVIIAVGLVSVTLSGMVMLMARSVQFVEVAHNRLAAVRIAKQNLETFRFKRDSYVFGLEDNGTSSYWSGFVTECTKNSGGYTVIGDNGKSESSCATTTCNCDNDICSCTSDCSSPTIQDSNPIFYYWSVACNPLAGSTNNDILVLVSTVQWSDFKGNHVLSEKTALSNWK